MRKSERPIPAIRRNPADRRIHRPVTRRLGGANWGAVMAWTLRGLAVVAVLAAAAPSQAHLTPGGPDERIELLSLETPSGEYNAGIVLLTRVQNYAGAAKWLLRAAGHGHAPAQAVLGYLYAVGLGVPEDFVRAYAWLHVAMPQLSGKMRSRAEDLQRELANVLTHKELDEAMRISQNLTTK